MTLQARPRHWLALSTALAFSAAAPAAGVAHTAKPIIKGAEVGYFGSAVVTHQVSVFVYLNQGPSSGNRVTVCLGRVCERAHGHNARLAWYSASFKVTRGFRMWDLVRFTAIASNGAGTSRLTVADPLLCMRNNGSTPQS